MIVKRIPATDVLDPDVIQIYDNLERYCNCLLTSYFKKGKDAVKHRHKSLTLGDSHASVIKIVLERCIRSLNIIQAIFIEDTDASTSGRAVRKVTRIISNHWIFKLAYKCIN